MGEGREPVQTKPTAEIKDSQELGDEEFFFLSQTIDGLSSIESNEVLADCALKRDNLDDVIYVYKFISDPEAFEFLSNSTFEFINEGEGKRARAIASLYEKVLSTGSLSVFELGPFDINKEAVFIAYVNKKIEGEMQEKEDGLNIVWKGANQKGHLFNFLLEKTGLEIGNFPEELRSYGCIRMFREGDIIRIRFFGEAEKKTREQGPSYAPGILKNFEPQIKKIFKKKFPNMKIEIDF